MSDPDVIRPFRWDVRRRSELGSLPASQLPPAYEAFEDELLACCARVLAFAGDSDLVFVGRSPESLFDLLSGLLLDTSWGDRLSLLTVSLRWTSALDDATRRSVQPYFEELGLDPRTLVRRARPIALVDVVDSGGTFVRLVELLHAWSGSDSVDWRAVVRKLRIVGLTMRQKTSPNTWRWQQHAEWERELRPRSIKNVSISGDLLAYLADGQPKTTAWFPPRRWRDASVAEAPRHVEAKSALALALHLFDLGRDGATRARFARELGRQPAMTEPWFRSLALEVKR